MKTYDELLKLYDLPLDELLKIAKQYTFNDFEFCSLVNARNGKCSQDCKYCAQSCHYKTNIESYPLMDVEKVLDAAKESLAQGAINFGIVTSGKTPDEDKDFDKILLMVKKVSELGLNVCASLGICDKEKLLKLKNAGLKRFHHNINTSFSYHSEICTTHTYIDRITTCKNVKETGLELCSGVIIGMGETKEQRIEMALELAQIEPDSIPINILMPIKGTPFENYLDKIDEENIIRTIAIMKISNPKSSIRLAGGKKLRLSEENILKLMKNCIDSTIAGNMLTTTGFTMEEERKKVLESSKTLKTLKSPSFV